MLTFVRVRPYRPNLAHVEAMRWRAADRVAHRGIHRQVEVASIWVSRIRAGDSEFLAPLPPAVLSDDDTLIQRIVETGLGAHRPVQRPNLYPIAVPHLSGRRGCRVQLDFRMERASAQTWQ